MSPIANDQTVQMMNNFDSKAIEIDVSSTTAHTNDKIEFFICGACSELLFEPVTLPCGYSLCNRCLRVKEPIYKCPIKFCEKLHTFRNDSISQLLKNILTNLFPIESDAYRTTKEAEYQLLEYLKDTCARNSTEYSGSSENILGKILLSLNQAISIAPNLQLPYIIRAKVYNELFLFEKAIEDCHLANRLNYSNKRGLVSEKIVKWRREHHQSNLNILSICALSQLGPDGQISQSDVVSDLHAELKAIRNSKSVLSPPESWDLIDRRSFSMAQWNLSLDSFECSICFGSLIEPVTTPCGHTFCKICLLKSLAGSQNCPICRNELPAVSYFFQRPTNRTIEGILEGAFQIQGSLNAKCNYHEKIQMPLFICSLVFPFSTPSFQMFEPRYRALVKTCLENNQEFIIAMGDGVKGYKEFGTALRITNAVSALNGDFELTSLGKLPRYFIETVATHKYRILSTSLSANGYQIATVERIDDLEVDDCENFNVTRLNELMDTANSFVERLLNSVPMAARLTFERQHGRSPENPNKFSYWMASILPLNPQILYEILPTNNVLERLEKMNQWIQQASSV